MDKKLETIGEILIEYDNILDQYNMTKLCSHIIDENKKITDLSSIMIKKYKDNLNNELLNFFILNFFIIYDKHSQIKSPDKCLNQLEKIIDDYTESLSTNNLKIYITLCVNLFR